ncbi:Winged helix-turn-helix transcription repressor DNA-binding [Penicillium coprophilum]|uniref:Winged helix-turn-helix transcription repressor DNA-binding n=1 Tax=Penicillium coprophilum TaxID=36646 RepID=UPI00238B2DF3|nr:Winged helix-turn-helix transcription repressor DNA-binding [Penicillium coprophilum]KAJ5165182.1 Winged helix-turn-helix transcription repressor DNA-binding [Penicillium coprophilum]
MADLGGQRSRNYRPHGPASSTQRDAAYSDIFGDSAILTSSRSYHVVACRTSSISKTPAAANTANAKWTWAAIGTIEWISSTPTVWAIPSLQSRDLGDNVFTSASSTKPPGSQQRFASYPRPQRLESRPSPAPQYPEPRDFNRPMPPPALNSDSSRSRSMARLGGPPYQIPPSNFNHTSATASRREQYHSGAQMTQLGRPVPEKHANERAMSMTSWSSDRDPHIMNSGRSIPHRRPPSGHDQQIPIRYDSMMQPSPDESVTSRQPSDASQRSRTMSMASTVAPDRTMSVQSQATQSSGGKTTLVSRDSQRKVPVVYPALLSLVAEVFREKISLGERQKNGLSYQNAFSGTDSVDLIGSIIRTNDRNLALLLGRALDAQKFFHDVTYDHRLRDAPGEVYQFKETMGEDKSTIEVNGVFTLLTECYSPTCTKDTLCYSIACPRRLEQQARLNLKPQPVLGTSESKTALPPDDDDDNDNQKLWISTVPKEVSDSVDDHEKKRQEVIFELMYTERDFVKDLEYLRDFWMRPLRAAGTTAHSPIPEHRREKFIRTVFGNCLEVLKVNSALCEALNARQKESQVVQTIGDIFCQHVPNFDPFIKYGANQLYGKYEFEKEKSSNPAFAKFVEDTERLKESRKLELNGYLTKPTTRLARYPLLLEGVYKHSADGNPDKEDIPKAIKLIKDFLSRVNAESGKAENHFNLVQLNAALKFNSADYVDLKLTEENRQMIMKMSFKKTTADSSDVTAYLFDHAVLLVRVKTVNKREESRVYRKPIPLELLVIAQMEEVIPRLGIAKRPSSSLLSNKTVINNPPPAKDGGLPITFRHLGKGGYEQTLYATSSATRRKFIEAVEQQQHKLWERNSNFYNKTILSEGFFAAVNRINCLVPIDGGRKLVYGTDNGIFVSERWPKDKSAKPRKVLEATQVTQIDTLEEYQLLLVLANKTLSSYPMDALDIVEGQNIMAKRPKKIQGHANFFKAGIGLGRHLVCSVKTSALSSTIKVYEPMDNLAKGKKKSAVSKMFQGGQDTLKPFKEYYIPAESSSIHFLRSTLCVGCARGFEVVSLETTETQSLLDQADTSLDFVARKENVKPIHIERMNGEFLLNYSDFSFFVNRNGWRARPDWRIAWEGNPNAFALSYPYILAFEPNFVEIRHVETSELTHLMTGKNIRMLHSSTREIIYAYEDEQGYDTVASLDFWTNKPQAAV